MVDKINCYILVLALVISDYKILDGKFSNLRFTFLCLEIAGANLKLVSPNDVTASLYSST